MASNFYMYFIIALIPLIVGFVYYNNKVLGRVWMKVNLFTEESLKGGNMAVIFILSYIFSLLLTIFLTGMVIHQGAVASLFAADMANTSSEGYQDFMAFMEKYGDRHRTFGHGAFHGALVAIFIIFPVIGTNALFERRGWKYILIHTGYWLISLILMGGLLCQTLNFEM